MRFTLGRAGRAVTTTAVVLTTLGAMLSASPGTAQAMAGGRHYQEPVVGRCHNYTLDAAKKQSNSSPAVSCYRDHTAKVFAVAQLPIGVTWESPASRIQTVMMRACYPKFERLLGRTAKIRHRTAYEIVWFMPNADQRDHGARWIRCDVTLWGGVHLRALPNNSTPMLPPTPLTDRISRCLLPFTKAPTVCGKTHSYRATGAITVDRTTYPGDEALQIIGEQRCVKHVRSTYQMTESWPSQAAWRADDRIIVCYSHTSN